MNKLISVISSFALAFVLLTAAFTIEASTFGDLNATSNTSASSWGELLASESYVDTVLSERGLLSDSVWRTGKGGDLYNWASTSSNPDTVWKRGFWAQFRGTDGKVYIIDYLYKSNNTFIVSKRLSEYGEHGKKVMLTNIVTTSPVPVPGALWLFGTAIVGLVVKRKVTTLTAT
jgi:hypothetical protein